MWWPFGKKQPRLSRDLSEKYEGILEITIEGVGSAMRWCNADDSLAYYVSDVHVCFRPDVILIKNEKKSPWEIVSFDREACKLVVRPVK